MKPEDSNMVDENETRRQRIKKALWWSLKWVLFIALIRGLVFLIFSC